MVQQKSRRCRKTLALTDRYARATTHVLTLGTLAIERCAEEIGCFAGRCAYTMERALIPKCTCR